MKTNISDLADIEGRIEISLPKNSCIFVCEKNLYFTEKEEYHSDIF